MKRSLLVLLALVLALGGCARRKPADAPPHTDPPAVAPPVREKEPAEPFALYEPGGLEIAIPTQFLDALVVETESEAWSEHWEPLLSLSEKASVEAYAKDHDEEDWSVGWLCSVSRLDRIGFETWLSGSEAGGRIFARDGADNYYLMARPTETSLYRSGYDGANGAPPPADAEMWNALEEWVQGLGSDIIARNGDLSAYDASELTDADYTYPGAHIELGCRFPGKAMDQVVFSLSQPARQGEGGVWCVERVRYVYSDYAWSETHITFPAFLGVDMAAADYYAQLQAECDAGEHPELLTARGAALDFAQRGMTWLLGEDVSASDFEVVESVG